MKKHFASSFLILLILTSFILADYGLSSPFLKETDTQLESSGDFLGFSDAYIRELEENGFGGSLDSIIDAALSSGRLIFLFFYADWCHFCNLEKPIVDELGMEFSERILFIRLNEKLNQEAMQEFMVDGYPTMFLIYGEDSEGYKYVEFRGYKEKTQLKNDLEYVLVNLRPPPTSEGDLLAELELIANEGSLHHTCDIDACLGDCRIEAGFWEEDVMRVLYEMARFTGECSLCVGAVTSCVGLCSAALTACAGTLGAACLPSLGLCAGCWALFTVEELSPGPGCGGCIEDFSQLQEAAREMRETLESCSACCEDPMSCEYGAQECKDPDITGLPDAQRCVDNNMVTMTCEECDWVQSPGTSISSCPQGTHCVETSTTMAECREDDDDDGGGGGDDDDDDDCSGLSCDGGGGGGGGGGSGPSPGPGNDHPDDTYDVSTVSSSLVSPSLEQVVERPKVAILERGYYLSLMDLMSGLSEHVSIVDLSFTQEMVNDYPVLLIPSGGLFGLGSSNLSRSKLEEYVAQGGTLITFSQQHGYDYNVLPGGLVDGFGWIEDQSCQYGSTGISTYRPFLSGILERFTLQTGMISLEVDGYFTRWPQDASVILTRVKNGLPVMLEYQYGKGTVIASTLFSDFSHLFQWGHTMDDTILIRDLINWAKNPDVLPDYLPGTEVTIPINVTNHVLYSPSYPQFDLGSNVTLSVNITNSGEDPSTLISFLLVDPYYNLHSVNVSETVLPDETKTLNVTFETTGESLEGVWYILYKLYAGDVGIWSGYAGAFTLGANIVDVSTYTVGFTLLDPDGQVVETRTIPYYVRPSETVAVNFTYTPTKSGIWSLDYVVRDYRDVIIDFGISNFAVSRFQESPNGWVYQGAEIGFTITSDSDIYSLGTKANVTFHVWNRGDENVTTFIFWEFERRGLEEMKLVNVPGFGEAKVYRLNETLLVPANSYANLTYTLDPELNDPSGRTSMEIYAQFFAGSYCGYMKREVWIYAPSVDLTVKTDKEEYFSGENVTITLDITNKMSYSFDLSVSVEVYAPGGVKILQTIVGAHLLNFSSVSKVVYLHLPALAKDGVYGIRAEQMARIVEPRVQLVSTSSRFRVAPYTLQVVSRSAPDVFYPHTNVSIALTVKNVGKQDVPNGVVNVTFASPEGLLWKHEQSFGLMRVNDSQNFTFTVPIGELDAETYSIVYCIQYGPDKSKTGSIYIISSLTSRLSLNRRYFQAGDAFNLTLWITNDGNTRQTKTVFLEVPDLAFNATGYLDLQPLEIYTYISPTFPLPMDIDAGQHEIRLYLLDDGDSPASPTSRFYFTVPEPIVTMELNSTSYVVGEAVHLLTRNTGGINASLTGRMTLMHRTGRVIAEDSYSVTLVPDGATDWALPIPNDLPTGMYLFQAEVLELTTNETKSYTMTLWIDGLDVDLTVETEQDVYSRAELIRILSQINNSLRSLDNGTLHLEVTTLSTRDIEAAWTYYDYPLPYYVNAIDFDDVGAMWLGTRDGGVIRMQGDTWTQYRGEYGLVSGSIEVLAVDTAGNVWVSNRFANIYSSRGVSVFNGTVWTRYSEFDSGLVSDYVRAIAADPDGSVWFGTYYGVSHYDGVDWFTYNESNSGLPDDYIYDVAVAPNGDVWFATGNGAALFNGTHWTVYNTANSSFTSNSVYAIAVNADGNVWFGTYNTVSVFNGSAWKAYTSSDGLASGTILTIEIDESGKVWVGTTGGISMFEGSIWTTYDEVNSGLADSYIYAIAVDPSETAWVGYYGHEMGVAFFNGSTWRKYIPSIISNDVEGFALDKAQNMWVVTTEGVSCYDGDDWVHFTTENSGLLNNDVRSVAVDNAGDVWFGHYCDYWPDCGISRFNGTVWTTYTYASEGVQFDRIYSIVPDKDGNMWFGTESSGVYKYDGVNWTVYKVSNSGLPTDYASLIALDGDGVLWVGTTQGVSRFDGTYWVTYNTSNSDLPSDYVTGIAVDSTGRVWVTSNNYLYPVSSFDGAGWTSYSGPSIAIFGSLAIDNTNNIWFGTDDGAVRFDGETWIVYNTTNSGIIEDIVSIGFADESVWFASTQAHPSVCVLTQNVTERPPLLWQADVSLNIPEGAANTTFIDVGSLDVTGKLFLTGVLRSADGHVLATDRYSFYIVDGDLTLTFGLDKDIYLLDEVVTVTGTVRNTGSQPRTDLTLEIHDGTSLIHSEDLNVDPDGSYNFTATYTAETLGTHMLTVELLSGGAAFIENLDSFEVGQPALTVDVSAPSVVGLTPFMIDVLLNNTGIVDATVIVNSTISETISPGEARLIQFAQQINQTKTFTLQFTGDYVETSNFTVLFGASANISCTPQMVYLEGLVSIPYQVINTGVFDLDFDLVFYLNESATSIEELYLPAGANITGTLLYNLTEGTYEISCFSLFGTCNAIFAVAKENQLTLTVSEIESVNGTIQVQIAVDNIGANSFYGTLSYDTGFDAYEIPLTLPVSDTFALQLNVSTLAAPAGEYNLTIQLNTDSSVLYKKILAFEITRADLRFTSIPVNASFQAGQLANMTFKVANVGGEAGEASVALTMPGIYNVTQFAWVSPGEEVTFNFTIPIPDDLPEGSFDLYYALNDVRNKTKIFVYGSKIAVTAVLDKRFYSEGENATLAITVENLRNQNLTLFSTVGYEVSRETQFFNLSSFGAEYLTFEVPVQFLDQPSRKVLYTVYTASGRALYINSLYIYPLPPFASGITVHTDRSVYGVGETVTITVNASRDGLFEASAPNFHVEENVTGVAVYTFTVPELLSGTYSIDYTFDGYAQSYPFDVDGYSASITEISLDKEQYTTGEDVHMRLVVNANRDFAALLRTTLYDQYFAPIDRFSLNVSLVRGENLVEITRTIVLGGIGIYAINPRIYVDLPAHSFVLVAAGSRFFDVTSDIISPAIIITSPQNITYAADAINLNYTVNEPTLWEGYSLDGNANVTLTGNKLLTELTQGPHWLTVYANDTSGNMGSSTVWFTVNLHPVAVVLSDPSDITDNSMKLTWTENADADFENYTIYMSTAEGTIGTLIHTVTEKTTTSYVVTGLSPETTYYFTIRVYDTGGLYADSNQASGKTKATPFPWATIIAVAALIGITAIAVVVLMKRRKNPNEYSLSSD